MNIRPIIYLLCLACAAFASAQSADDNIIINSKQDIYTYKIVAGKPLIDNSNYTFFQCIDKPELLQACCYYDNFSEIKKATVKGMGKITPQYEMYHDKGIFFNDSKICYFNLPFKRKGEEAHVLFEKRYNDIFQFKYIYFAENYFIKEKIVEVVLPDWLELQIVEKNFGDNITKTINYSEKDKKTTYSYHLKNMLATKKEDDAPHYTQVHPYILVIPKKAEIKGTTSFYFDTYDHVYQWCKSMTDKTYSDMAVIEKKAAEITQKCLTDEDKIKEIYSWVQNNIRYIAIENGLLGYIPDNAHDVLKKKYGDCKGMSNLLKALLRSQGFDARLAWVGTREVAQDSTITLPGFNHMICALFRDNDTCFLDPTIQYMAIREYHEAIQGQMTMIEDGDNYIRQRIPAITASQNVDSLYCEYTIKNGLLSGDARMSFTGQLKHEILSFIHSQNASMREARIKQFILGTRRPQDKVFAVSISNIDGKSDTVAISYKEERLSGIQTFNDELYISMDTYEDFTDLSIDTAKRKNDYLFPLQTSIIRIEHLIIPQGYEPYSLPKNLMIERPNYTFQITYSLDEGLIKYHKEIVTTDVWLKKKDFVNWNTDLEMLRKCYNEHIILKKKTTEL